MLIRTGRVVDAHFPHFHVHNPVVERESRKSGETQVGPHDFIVLEW